MIDLRVIVRSLRQRWIAEVLIPHMKMLVVSMSSFNGWCGIIKVEGGKGGKHDLILIMMMSLSLSLLSRMKIQRVQSFNIDDIVNGGRWSCINQDK